MKVKPDPADGAEPCPKCGEFMLPDEGGLFDDDNTHWWWRGNCPHCGPVEVVEEVKP